MITIEDPIEFIYTNKRSIIEQREIGSDTAIVAFGAEDGAAAGPGCDCAWVNCGTWNRLRSRLAAAETGHLVMASVHSSTAAGALSRIVDVFPVDTGGAGAIAAFAVPADGLCTAACAGRIPETRILMYEILMGTPAISNMIRSNEIEQIPNAINAGRDHGMISFSKCQRDLIGRGLIVGFTQ